MRIRTLLGVSLLVTLLLVLAIGYMHWKVARQKQDASTTLAHAQATANDIFRLTLLTHEYAPHAEARVAQQMREILAFVTVQHNGGHNAASGVALRMPDELRRYETSLSELFEQLEAISQLPETPLQSRRKQLLIEKMLTNVTILYEDVRTWQESSRAEYEAIDHQLHQVHLASIGGLLALISALGLLLALRVLRPLARLQAVVRAVAEGDLTRTSAIGTNDELGYLSRTFDAMAIDMVTSLRKEVAERKAAEAEQRRLLAQVERDRTALLSTLEDKRRTEEALRESEATVRKKLKAIVEPEGDISTLELSDIMDIDIMQSMMEEFGRATGMLGAVLDLSGKVLVAFGWQDICTKFHRCHPDTLKNCVESDTALTRGVSSGTVKVYRCKNNMWDMVTPLVVGDRHIGNVFFGQFFYEGETPDVELFRAQARQYGFNETEYLAALARVPHFNREAAEAGLLFFARLAGIVTTLSYNAIKQARMLAERDRLRNKLITLNRELEVKVEQRTAALEASNKELEAFSYSVSHDLRAPLRHISGYVELLNNRFREALPEKAGHYLHEITDSSRQMGALIDDLLQFSRTGRQELRQEDMDMNTVVQEALLKLKPDTQDRNISWTVADLPRVFGDSSLLTQVWINLLDNAVKYTRYKGEAKVEVGCTRADDQFEFYVRDNGVGFDIRYAHKLFGVFQRLHSPAQFEGTGIGLANVQRIVHKHGGRVRAEGRPDEGATFYFTLPAKSFDEGDTP